MLMKRTCETNPLIQELTNQISTLEDRFVELFVCDGSRDVLRKLHLEILDLKKELQFQSHQTN